jgi:predicted transcriptional regulator
MSREIGPTSHVRPELLSSLDELAGATRRSRTELAEEALVQIFSRSSAGSSPASGRRWRRPIAASRAFLTTGNRTRGSSGVVERSTILWRCKLTSPSTIRVRWASTADVKRLYATASIVSADRSVFNIKGNDIGWSWRSISRRASSG